MHRYFISDLHLDAGTPHTWRLLDRFADTIASNCDGLYILGDLTEVWVGDDDDAPETARLAQWLRAAAQRFPVYLMHGNRDFLIGEPFTRDAGVDLIPDPFPLDTDVVLCHGDSLCTDDVDYQKMRALFRDPAWQEDILARPLAERRALAAQLRAASASNNANKASNIMDVNQIAVAGLAADHDASIVIHGHTHRPGIHTAAWGTRYVLGDWNRCGWFLEEREGALTLNAFSV